MIINFCYPTYLLYAEIDEDGIHSLEEELFYIKNDYKTFKFFNYAILFDQQKVIYSFINDIDKIIYDPTEIKDYHLCDITFNLWQKHNPQLILDFLHENKAPGYLIADAMEYIDGVVLSVKFEVFKKMLNHQDSVVREVAIDRLYDLELPEVYFLFKERVLVETSNFLNSQLKEIIHDWENSHFMEQIKEYEQHKLIMDSNLEVFQ